jgi:hypothetical protein
MLKSYSVHQYHGGGSQKLSQFKPHLKVEDQSVQ